MCALISSVSCGDTSCEGKARSAWKHGHSRNALAWMWQQMNRNPHTTLAACQQLDWGVTEKLGIMHRCAVGSNNTLFSLLEFPPFSYGTLPESVLLLYWGWITHLLLSSLLHTNTHTRTQKTCHKHTQTLHLPLTARGHCMSCREGVMWGKGVGGYKHPLLAASSPALPSLHFPKSSTQRPLVLQLPHPCHHPAARHTNPSPAKKMSARLF